MLTSQVAGDDEGPMMDDDGQDAEGAPQQPK
jgi:hypothetical protein